MRLIDRLATIIASESRARREPPRAARRAVPSAPRGSPASGFADPKDRAGTRRIVVRVDDEVFDRLAADAAARCISLSEAVRRALARGLKRSGPAHQSCGDSSAAERGSPRPEVAGDESCSPLQT